MLFKHKKQVLFPAVFFVWWMRFAGNHP